MRTILKRIFGSNEKWTKSKISQTVKDFKELTDKWAEELGFPNSPDLLFERELKFDESVEFGDMPLYGQIVFSFIAHKKNEASLPSDDYFNDKVIDWTRDEIDGDRNLVFVARNISHTSTIISSDGNSIERIFTGEVTKCRIIPRVQNTK